MDLANIIIRAIQATTTRGSNVLRIHDYFLLRAGLVAAAIIVGNLAILQTVKYAKFNELRTWANKVESNGRLYSADTLPVGKMSTLIVDKECQARFVNSALTLALVAIDDIRTTTDSDGPSRALDDAARLIIQGISCHPTSGNLWLRLAMITHVREQLGASVVAFLRLSQLYTPAERDVLQGRYAQYARMSHQQLVLLSDSLEKDLGTICSSVMGWQNRKDLSSLLSPTTLVLTNRVTDCLSIGSKS
jgi:hypothetical protein